MPMFKPLTKLTVFSIILHNYVFIESRDMSKTAFNYHFLLSLLQSARKMESNDMLHAYSLKFSFLADFGLIMHNLFIIIPNYACERC